MRFLGVWVLMVFAGLGVFSFGWCATARPEMQPPRPAEGIELPADEDRTDLDEMAEKPYRPSWAPIPVLHGQTMVVRALHDLLKSDAPADRARSAFILGQIACPDSLPLLAERLQDKDRSVRVQAGIALGCMGDKRGKHVCAAVIQNDEDWVRYYGVLGLSRLMSAGVDVKPIKLVLTRARFGQSALVTRAVEGALKPNPPPPPVDKLGAASDADPAPDTDEIWEQAADAMTRESDWWFHKGDYDQAIRCSEASIFLDPDYVETYTVVAWLEWSMGNDREAVGTLHRAIGAAPEDPEAYFGLGYHYFNTKRYASALPYLNKAVELGIDHLGRRTHAHCLERLGKLKESLAAWEALLKDRPGDGSVIVNRDRLKRLVEEQKAED